MICQFSIHFRHADISADSLRQPLIRLIAISLYAIDYATPIFAFDYSLFIATLPLIIFFHFAG
jgi:hypothetical protein